MSDAFWDYLFKFLLAAFGIYMTWRMKQVGDKVEVVKKATNGLVKKLEDAAEAHGFLAGVKSETDKKGNL